MCHPNICSVITYRMYNHSFFTARVQLAALAAAAQRRERVLGQRVFKVGATAVGADERGVPCSESLMSACTHALLARLTALNIAQCAVTATSCCFVLALVATSP